VELASRFPLFFVIVLVAATPAVGRATVVTDGLVYEWSLNEASGTTAVDAVSGRHMQDHGSPSRGVPGISGGAYAFDGVDDYLASASSLETFGSEDFTLSAWVRSSAPQDKVATILFHQSSAGWFELALSYDGKPYFFAQDYQTTGYISLGGGPRLTDGQWHLVSLVREGHSAYLYADALLVASGSNDLLGTVTGTSGLFIGGTSRQSYYDGAIDDVAVYSRALSPNEIAANAVPEPMSLFLTIAGLCSIMSGTRFRRCPHDS
jgi:hypothetical protein